MSKIEKSKEVALKTNENALGLIPNAEEMDEEFVAPSTGEWLPLAEMVFPIMITPEKPEYKGMEYRIGFKDGGGFTPFPEGTILSLVDKRNSVREKVETDEGKRNKYYYAPITRKGQKFDKSAAGFNDRVGKGKGEANIDEGYSAVIVAIFPDGKTVVTDFSVFRTMTSYIYPVISPALLMNKVGVELQIEDHSCNLKKSKTGHFYPDAKKFKQFAHVQLSKTQLSQAVEALNNSAEAYSNWLNR